MKVGVIDYGVGNLGSVLRALQDLRVLPVLLENPRDSHTVDRLVLPGVGSFAESKGLLDSTGWTEVLDDEVKGSQKPLLGICLGMQLLADFGLEGAEDERGIPGLGYIPGRVCSLVELGCRNRVPHMGWNSLAVQGTSALLYGIVDKTDFYFVHSYGFVPTRQEDVLAVTDYGILLTAVVGAGHVWGTQFHPERSSRAGLRVLRNFVEFG